jgi:hypothetical protein
MEVKRLRDWLLSSAWYDDRTKRIAPKQPEDRIMRGILVLVLSLLMAATQDKPVAPAEQYRALIKEAGDAGQAKWKATTDEERKQAAARPEPLPLKLLELAEKNPNEPWTLDALTHVITLEYWLDNYSSHPGCGKDSRQARAVAILLRDHVRSDKLGETCKRVQFCFRKECETFLRTVLDKNPHRDVQGQASLRLALFLNARLNRLDLLKDQPLVNNRYEGLYRQDYLDALRRQDRAKAVAEVARSAASSRGWRSSARSGSDVSTTQMASLAGSAQQSVPGTTQKSVAKVPGTVDLARESKQRRAFSQEH